MPTDQEYETSLRNAVKAHFSDPEGDITVKSTRTKSEEDLGLETGFYKNSDLWKDKSKEIIQDQVNKCENEQAEVKEAEETRKTLKRASPATTSRPRKKSKLDEEDESTALSEPPESASDEDSYQEEVAPKKKAAKKQAVKKGSTAIAAKSAPRKKAKRESSTSELSDAPSPGSSEPEEDPIPPSKAEDKAEDSSSELSSVIDEPQPSRKSSKSKNGSTSKSSKPTSKAKAKAPVENDPKAEEIKRLQGWLVKCGIRKVWGKELKPFETQNAKISHLKSMLSDAGMSGRYSNEKAAQIKEARELAADLEAVQEGNELWGKDGEGDEAETQDRGGRRLVRGAKNYDFLSSDGEEESD